MMIKQFIIMTFPMWDMMKSNENTGLTEYEWLIAISVVIIFTVGLTIFNFFDEIKLKIKEIKNKKEKSKNNKN